MVKRVIIDGQMMLQTTIDEQMGTVFKTLTATNWIDRAKAEEALIAPDRVRSVTLENVLVDKVATTLCLPADVIAELGLKPLREVKVETAIGTGKGRIFQEVSISLLERTIIEGFGGAISRTI